MHQALNSFFFVLENVGWIAINCYIHQAHQVHHEIANANDGFIFNFNNVEITSLQPVF